MAGRRIQLQGFGRQDEATAAAAGILPGMLLRRSATNSVNVHNVSGGNGLRMIALEDALQGKSVDDAYASGDQLQFTHAEPGHKLNLRIPAGAAAIAVGDQLISNGAGFFIKTTGTPTQIFAIAREAKDNSAGGSSVLIEAEMI